MYENGKVIPSPDAIRLISDALNFPSMFFFSKDIDFPQSDGVSFRALSSMTSKQRDMALGAAAIAIEINRWIESKFILPEADLPDLREHSPHVAAEMLRSRWGLGEKPVRNMVHLLEAHGVRVYSIAEKCRNVDAFSLWDEGRRPFVFLNTMKSAERSRFDASHELAHLVLHYHGDKKGRDAEREADSFASAFLMPTGSVLAVAPRNPSLKILIQLKRIWNVSLSALVHRLFELKMISEWQNRTLCIEISQKGFRTSEPHGIQRESSQVLKKVFDSLRGDGIGKADLARKLHLNESDIDQLVFGLTMVAISGNRKAEHRNSKPNLRLISGSN